MLTGATAVHALSVTGVQSGDTVLIHGASGGVGQMALYRSPSLAEHE